MWNHQIFIKIIFIVLSTSIQNPLCSSQQPQNANSNQSSSPAFSESKAIEDVIREFYIANHIPFDLLVYGETSNHINDVIDGVIKQVSHDALPVTLKRIKDIREWNHKMSQSAVIFVKSQKTLEHLHDSLVGYKKSYTLLTNREPKPFKFLVYVEEIKSLHQLNDSISKNNQYSHTMPADLRLFEFFITSDELQVNLTARLLYSEDHCGEFKLKVLNSVDKRSQQWTRKLENFEQFSNFHGCLMPFCVAISRNFYVEGANINEEKNESLILLKSGHAKFAGLTNEIVRLLAQTNNFSFHFSVLKHVPGSNKPYDFIPTKNFKLPMNHLIPLENIVIDRESIFHFTVPFASVDWYCVLSLNTLYTNYEKLLFPFDVATWSLLLLTLVLTFGTILGLRFFPQWISTMILGRG
jgi:hypothetical protein